MNTIIPDAAPARHLSLVPPLYDPTLGPAPADMPDHPAWCTTHDNAIGDGTSFCHADVIELGAARFGLMRHSTDHQPFMWMNLRAPEGSVDLTPGEARELAEQLLRLADVVDAEPAKAA